jgi:excisionase family DNA binding protein
MEFTATPERRKTFLSISVAAEIAGCSERHFRRIIVGNGIRVVQIGRKFFILNQDFLQWKSQNPKTQKEC